ncbi:MAG: methionine adenosyltransferase [Mollicutes bacterium]|nr:methionine adenosyltransferase [Mollicutes bacterium]
MKKLFTSESVTIGHPDKMCDQIADAILDAYLTLDPNARVACEVCVHHQGVIVMGEITSKVQVNVERIVRNKIIEIGYDNDELLFNGHNCDVFIFLNKQSSDIALGVDQEGAGDQGIMFGYATLETKELMPYPIMLAHKLAQKLESVRKEKLFYLRPDGKTQVTIEYDNDKIKRVDTIVVSTQHDEKITIDTLRSDIIKYVIKEVIPDNLIDSKTKIFINPTGRFVIGGPVGDSGLTGRKVIVDTYGGMCAHGGGAFSGKDPTKVDRSASYYARYVAKHIVASGLASKCELQVSYAIGVRKPLSIFINTFNTNIIPEEKILEIINQVFNFSPPNMIKELDLRKPIYSKTSVYGHFGKEDLPWEQLNKLNEINRLKKKYVV